MGYPGRMTRQDKLIVAIALAPNLLAMLALFGWMAWRVRSGAPPMPHGAAPAAIFFCCLTPLVTIATASFLRLRRAGGQGAQAGGKQD